MLIERTENPAWLSNAYLVAGEDGQGVLIDGNDTLEPLLERVERDGIEVTHVLLTHVHPDHVAGLTEARERLGGPPLVAHADAAAEIDDEVAVTLGDGEKLQAGGLEVEAIFTPGHAAGHLAYLVEGGDVFTADVLFKGTVGGTMAPGASGLADLQASVMRLMELPPETRVHPGHREPTTIGEEWESNPFVRVWRGLDEIGNKAWVRFEDDGVEAIVGGSQVERE
jgi:hydroxyacylglutathione hydrolase